MVVFEGSHGTTKDRARNIKANGFQIKNSRTRYGVGVYFWNKSYHYINLAIGWSKYCRQNGRYYRDNNLNYEVIIAQFTAAKNEVLDLENAVLKDKIAKLAEEKNIGEDWAAISSLVESFVEVIQEELKTEFKIVLKKASPPPKECCPEYPYKLLGWPDCCIIRDIRCIELK
jgi:hypothetical protein